MNESSRTLAIGANQVFVFADRASACLSVADLIAATIRANLADRGKSILGLATGATPVPIYARLVELHRSTGLSFAGVSTFNLDEYYPMSPLDPRSYRAYMHRNLFEHVDLRPNRAHVLDGTVPLAFAGAHASDFDRWIAADGGLDMQLLGIGRNGHIGFNEPIAGDDADPAGRAPPDDGGRRRPRLRRRRARPPPRADDGHRADPGEPVDPGRRLRPEQGGRRGPVAPGADHARRAGLAAPIRRGQGDLVPRPAGRLRPALTRNREGGRRRC